MFEFPVNYLDGLFAFFSADREHRVWMPGRFEIVNVFGPLTRLDPGLSESEFAAVEGEFGFTFPPDLRAPVGGRGASD